MAGGWCGAIANGGVASLPQAIRKHRRVPRSRYRVDKVLAKEFVADAPFFADYLPYGAATAFRQLAHTLRSRGVCCNALDIRSRVRGSAAPPG